MSIRILLASVQTLSGDLFLSEVTSKVTISIGTFSLPDEAKLDVIDMVIRKALHAIAAALVHLWERAGKLSSPLGADQVMSNDALMNQACIYTSTSDDLSSVLARTEDNVSLLHTLQRLMTDTEKQLRSGAY